MAIITFWSNLKKETGKTASMAAIATQMAVEHNYKILLLSTIYNDETIDRFFWKPREEDSILNTITNGKEEDISSGVDGLVKLTMSNKLTPNNITNYTKLIFPGNRLELITGATEEDYQRIARESNIFKDIAENANNFYDYVFIDLDKGLERSHVREILAMSDLIVVTLPQQIGAIKDFEKLKKKTEMFNKDNVILLLGRYDAFSKYNTKNVARTLGYKGQTCSVPYNTLYMEATGEGKVADYFLRYRKLKPDDRNALFINEVEYAGNTFIEKIRMLQNYR